MIDRFLPSQCDTCRRACLMRLGTAAFAPCPKCGGRTHITPGELYRADDAGLFERIETAVARTGLTESQRLQVTAELNNVAERTRAPVRMVTRLIEVLPPLRFMLEDSPASHHRLVRGLGMLLAIVSGQSGRLQQRNTPSRERGQGLQEWLELASGGSDADSSSKHDCQDWPREAAPGAATPIPRHSS